MKTAWSFLIGAVGLGLGLASLSLPAQAKSVCNTHTLGYTQAQCNACSNMIWSTPRPFPRGVCVATGAPTPAPTCTLTGWGGATLPLHAPNFSQTGAPISVCRNGYNLARSQLHCSSGTPAQAPSHPNTNVTCSGAAGAGFNPQITITGTPCCI